MNLEHIFVAKAMIAGFNASVVDLGASGYDAVIENQENKLLRVQIKVLLVIIFLQMQR